MFRELALAVEKSICIREWVVSNRPLIDRNESQAAMAEAVVIIAVMRWLKMNEKHKLDSGRKIPPSVHDGSNVDQPTMGKDLKERMNP